MNIDTLTAFLKLISAASAAGVEFVILKNAYAAIQRETSLTDEQLFAETENLAGELDAKIIKRLAEIDKE